jgi:hypothetical protein
MDLDGGGYTLDLQAQKIAENAILYRGSAPCPMCGIIMDPVKYMYSRGLCEPCDNDRRTKRLKGRIV